MSEHKFFGRFAPFIQEFIHHAAWQELRPVQVEAARAIFDSTADVLITTGTASGKTEAAFLPILSLIHQKPGDSVQALYVGPLRALINDQFRRLEAVCERGGIPVHRWHGDVGKAEKAKFLKSPSGVLQITPESIESLFINRTTHLRKLFRSLRFVVVDETHTFLNSDRGVQLACQMRRLESYVEGARPRRIGLSATVGDADAAKRWLNPHTPDNVILVNPHGATSSIRLNLLHVISDSTDLPPALLDDLYQLTRQQRSLIFCNSRADVELATQELNDRCRRDRFEERYLPHHGSISKQLRETAELRMKEDKRPASVVCTNTLELGIDIGSLDLVAQIDSTHTVSALAQRLGRSGRRSGSPRVMQLYTTQSQPKPDDPFYAAIPFSMLQALAVVDLFRENWVEPPEISGLAYNVLYQQMLSYLAETNGASARQLVSYFAASSLFPGVTPANYETLLRYLGSTEQLQQLANGELLPGLKGEQILRSRDFYAVFQSPPEWTVAHGSRLLGTISPPSVELRVNDTLLLSGRIWRIVDILPRSKKYMVEPAANSRRTYFPRAGGPPIHSRIPERMRSLLFQADQPLFLSANGQNALTEARRLAQAFALDSRIGFDSDGEVVLIPWAGTRVMSTMARMLEMEECDPQLDGGWVLRLKSYSSLQRLKSILIKLCENPPAPEALAQTAQAGRKFEEYLPDSLLQHRDAIEEKDVTGVMRILHKLLDQIV